MNMLLPILKQSVVITGFVFVMMLIIEYINVQTHGNWQKRLTKHKWQQYLFAATMGVIPGCLGAFTVVAMYSHGLLSFGAIVATMIATSGDETFLMFATIPQTAILITIILFNIGIISGVLVDKFVNSEKLMFSLTKNELPLHSEDNRHHFERSQLLRDLMNLSFYRLLLIAIISTLAILIITGTIASDEEGWIKGSMIFVALLSLIIVLTVPEHFLKDHLWGHVAKVHTPRIFSWVFGTLLVFNILLTYFNIEALITENLMVVLLVAVLIGIIPESGPHFIFITLFVQGSIPFSILLASSISQDGHGMIPLLAESKKSFMAIKTVNVAIALVIGVLGILFGY